MGDPPPILLYCSWIFGVRRFAMNGPSLLQSGGQITSSAHARTLKGQYLRTHFFIQVDKYTCNMQKEKKIPSVLFGEKNSQTP